VRIAFRKVSDERHVLEIEHDDGRRESAECETRSFLQHDLLHYAAESEAKIDFGFWGRLAAGATLADLNDKELQGSLYDRPDMLVVEQVVGALTGAIRGRSPEDVVAGLHQLADAQAIAMPAWLTPAFVEAVQRRMHALLGQWRATRFGAAMELRWPDSRIH
jgi:hypothetical protein